MLKFNIFKNFNGKKTIIFIALIIFSLLLIYSKDYISDVIKKPAVKVHLIKIAQVVIPLKDSILMRNIDERIALLKSSGSCYFCDLTQGDFKGSDLKDADLRYAKLNGANLSNVNLSGANLSNANLSSNTDKSMIQQGASLKGANFSEANLMGADFSNQDLTGAIFLNAIFTGINLTGVNLTNIDLTAVNLSGVDLSNKDLTGTILSGATFSKDTNLMGVDLTNLDLTAVNLSGVDLSNKDLTGTILSFATLTGANLDGVDLRNMDLTGVNLSRVDLSNKDLTGTILSGTIFSEANLTGVNLTNLDLTSVNLSGANLNNRDLTGTILLDANFSGANLDGVDLRNKDLTGINLSGVDLSNKDLTGTILTGANFSGANLDGVDLRNKDLTGVNLSGVDLSNKDLTGVILKDAVQIKINVNPPSDLNWSIFNDDNTPISEYVNAKDLHVTRYDLRGDMSFIATKEGFLYELTNDELKLVLDLNKDAQFPFIVVSDTGLLGVVSKNNLVYISYAAKIDDEIFLVVDEYSNDFSEVRNIIKIGGFPPIHIGGALQFDSFGKLYLSTGDGTYNAIYNDHPQKLNDYRGKILRLDTSDLKLEPEVIAYGIRTPWGMTIDSKDRMFISQCGNSIAETVYFLNDLYSGIPVNLGWPVFEGSARKSNDPLMFKDVLAPIFETNKRPGCMTAGVYLDNLSLFVSGDFFGMIRLLKQRKDGSWYLLHEYKQDYFIWGFDLYKNSNKILIAPGNYELEISVDLLGD